MIDTVALREKVLDLAIRGKLVPQDPNDEPASVLLERIRQQKQQMVKDGKLKPKDIKGDTVIFVGEDNLHYEKFADGTVKCIEDEIPFELPIGWGWVRFGTVTINRDSERKPVSSAFRKNVEKKYDYYGASGKIDKVDSYLFDEKLLLIGEDGANLVARSKPIAFFAEGQYWVNNHAHCIDATDKRYLDYLCYYVNAINLEPYVTGSAQPKMNQDNMNSILISIPPFAEQLRIIAQIDSFYAIINCLEHDQQSLMDVIGLAKSKILDLAIRGNLVPQDPTDEPASILLDRIRAEKDELIRRGKIKRDKMESVIFRGEDNSYYLNDGQMTANINDDLPFDIPDSWRWTRLKDVFIINPRNKLNDDLDVSFIPMPLIDDGYSGNHIAEIRQWKKVKTGFTHFAEGDVGVAKITPCFENRKSTVFKNLANGYGAGTTELYVLRPFGRSILAHYLLAYVKSEYFVENGKQTFTGDVGQQRISREYVENAYFPVPPIKEQERIVQQISAVFEYLNMISDALS